MPAWRRARARADERLAVRGVGVDEEGGEGKAKGKAAKAAAKYEPLALYNLEEDPGEARNLAAAQPERVKAMQARLAELLRGAVPPGKPGAK